MGGDRHKSGLETGTGSIHRVREARRIGQPPEFSPNFTDIPYRAVSIFPSLLLARWGVSPNSITVLWGLIGLAGVIGLGWDRYWIRLAGALLLQLSYLFDYVDGEVARLLKRSSKRGFFIDLVAHGLIKTSLFLAIGYRVYLTTHRSEYLILAFVACVSVANGNNLISYAVHASVKSYKDGGTGGQPAKRRSPLRKILALSGYFLESAGVYAAVLVSVILDRLDWLLIFYAVSAPLLFFYRATRYRYE